MNYEEFKTKKKKGEEKVLEELVEMDKEELEGLYEDIMRKGIDSETFDPDNVVAEYRISDEFPKEYFEEINIILNVIEEKFGVMDVWEIVIPIEKELRDEIGCVEIEGSDMFSSEK